MFMLESNLSSCGLFVYVISNSQRKKYHRFPGVEIINTLRVKSKRNSNTN